MPPDAQVNNISIRNVEASNVFQATIYEQRTGLYSHTLYPCIAEVGAMCVSSRSRHILANVLCAERTKKWVSMATKSGRYMEICPVLHNSIRKLLDLNALETTEFHVRRTFHVSTFVWMWPWLRCLTHSGPFWLFKGRRDGNAQYPLINEHSNGNPSFLKKYVLKRSIFCTDTMFACWRVLYLGIC